MNDIKKDEKLHELEGIFDRAFVDAKAMGFSYEQIADFLIIIKQSNLASIFFIHLIESLMRSPHIISSTMDFLITIRFTASCPII